MQRTLASDPNVMVPRAPGTSSQLVAMGPPLTGHDTMTSTTLPSVLNPISRQPMMTYKQGLQAIFDETGPLLLRLTLLEPRPVSVVLYDTLGRPLNVSEGLVLNKESDIKAVVTVIQQLLDDTCDKDPTHDGSRLIVTVIEIRVGITDGTQGYPPLKGVCVQGQRGQWAKWVKWATHGDMEKYWQAYRIMLQTQAPNSSSVNSTAKPIFKVTTVRQLNNGGSHPGGHEFYDVSDDAPAPLPAIMASGRGVGDVGDILVTVGGSADASSEISTGSYAVESDSSSSHAAFSQGTSGSSSQPALSHGLGRLQLFDGAASNPDCHSGGPKSDGGDAPETREPKENAKPVVDPEKNWGFYQRMGGDPRMHKLYDLSHVPFEVDPEKLPAPKYSFNNPDILVTIRDAWSDNDTQGSLTPKAVHADGRASYDYVEKAWREYAAKELESAISFEDDSIYFPNADVNTPTQNDLLVSRTSIQSKQKGKDKAKEADSRNFFNDHCAPDGSQDHLLGASGYDIQPHGGQGKASELCSDSPYSGYAAPDGNRSTASGFFGYEFPTFDGMRNSSNADDAVSNQYSIQKHGVMLSPMMAATASKGRSHKKISSMNVHAAPFSNFSRLQANRGGNTSMSSPYLQSLAAAAPAAYTQPSAYGNMNGEARSSMPLLQYSSQSMSANQAASVQNSNSSVAPHAPGLMQNLNSPAFFSQTTDPSTILQSSGFKFGNSSSSIPGHPLPEQPMLASPGAFPVPKHGSPDMARLFVTAAYEHRRPSPDKQHSQNNSSRRQQSPNKSGGKNTAQTAILQTPSLDKPPYQQGFGAASQSVYNTGASSSWLQSSSGATFNVEYGLNPNPGFQHVQNVQHGFESNFQVPGHGSANSGGQGAAYGGVQGLSNTNGPGARQGNGQMLDWAGSLGSAQDGGLDSDNSRGGNWIYRGAKTPKREFGF